jgi:GT2 family glycosyltransferase
MPSVSIIIVNHNGAALLDDCLASLAAQTFRDFEVLLVDNGSTDGSVAKASSLLPGLRCIQLPENRGFAEGNNVGIREARGRYVVLANNDTQADPRFLQELVGAAERGARVGMVAPKILNFYNRAVIDSVGGLVLCRDGIAQGRGRGERDSGQYDHLDEILMPSACAALYRREVFDDVGPFDERFFAYCEDSDLGLRARRAGWKAVSAPAAVVYHKYSASSSTYSPLKMYLVERNHYWVSLKNLPWSVVLGLPALTVYRYALMAYAVLARRGKGTAGSRGALLGSALRAHLAALLGTPGALRRRTRMQRVSRRRFRQLLASNRLGIRKMILTE